MKKLSFLIFLAICVINISAQDYHSSNPITKELQYELQQAADNDLLRINIRLTDQYNVDHILNSRNSFNRQDIRNYVIDELKSFSAQSQQGILNELNYYSRSGEVDNIRSLWIANVLNCYATPGVIEQLATRNDVERIDIDQERILIDPIYGDDTEETKSGTKEITWNVLKVKAPDVWALGFTGEEVVVAVLDTGVKYNHNDLIGNMWTHPDYPFHGWNFVNNNNNPMDFHGHGTHCAGTIAGNGTSGSETGIAPGAKIMALQVLDNQGGGNESNTWAAIQFAVENGAHVMSLSIGWRHIWSPDRASFRNAMNNALAAGVIASVAAGNEGTGSAPSNVRTPGDVPPPWLHPDQTLLGGISAVVSVGATNSNDGMASFSSRGPVTWQAVAPFNDYPYNPGIGLIRPDIVAPGVDVKSLSLNPSGYTTMSGTSMATPCAAGVMALMISKNPNLLPEEVAQILEETAVKFEPIKNITSGSGRIDALEAINATNFPGPVYASHVINDIAGNNDGLINPSEFIQLTVALQNNSEDIFTNVTATLTTNSGYITILDDTQFYGTFNAGVVIEVENAFSFQVANNIPGGHEIRFWIETTDGDEAWQSNFNDFATAPNITSGNMIVHDPNGNNNGNLDPGEEATLKIPTLNIGQLDAEPATVTLSTDSEFVTILTGTVNLGPIPAGGSLVADFPVTVSENAPVGQSVTFTFNVVSGAYMYERLYYQKIGIIIEDFESGDFSGYDWAFGGNLPWIITDVNPFEGVYSAKSGGITHNQSTQMILDWDVGVDDSISFYRKVSSEANYDYLKFYINNQMVAQWAGTVDWGRVAFPVTAGFKTFKWEYMKDGSVSSGEDCAWIDFIEFPALASCPGPRNLHATSVTASSASLNWSPGGVELLWDVIWGPAGFDPTSGGTLIEDVIAIPHTITGLQGVTEYDFYVKAHCDGDESSAWSGPATFVTLCDIFDLPYVEPFGTPAISCWTFPEGQGNWNFGNSYTPPSSTSGAPNAFFNWSPSVTNYSFSFTSPLFDGSGMTEVKLNYILFANSYSASTVENMAVEYKALDGEDWILLENFSTQGLGNGNAEHVRTDEVLTGMAGNFFQVRFRAHGPNSFNINGWGLDDIHIHGEVSANVPGDANCDGAVNVLDGITIVNYIMGSNPEPFCFDNADVTGDGIINVLDIIGTVNIILSGTKTSALIINSATANIFLGRNGITLESDGTLAGLQFEIAGLDSGSLNFLLPGYEFVSTIKDDKLMGLIFSFDNTPIPAGKLNLFSFGSEEINLQWGNVVAGNLNAEEVRIIKHTEDLPNILAEEFKVKAFPNPSQGEFKIELNLPYRSEANVRIMDLMGREIRVMHDGLLSNGVHVFELGAGKKLSPGIYFLQINAVSLEFERFSVTRHVKLVVTE